MDAEPVSAAGAGAMLLRSTARALGRLVRLYVVVWGSQADLVPLMPTSMNRFLSHIM